MVILKHFFWPVNERLVHLWFRAVVNKEQFCVVVLKHHFWPVNKPQLTCGFLQRLKGSSFFVVIFKTPLVAS